MSNRPAIADPLGELFADSDEVAAGLNQLEQGPPLWGAAAAWRELVCRLRAFEVPWGGHARLAGWNVIELYGLHPRAPSTRLDAMSAGWVIARAGHQVLSVDHVGVLLVARTAARLRILRGKSGAEAVLAWKIQST
jgi:hypothetical protein